MLPANLRPRLVQVLVFQLFLACGDVMRGLWCARMWACVACWVREGMRRTQIFVLEKQINKTRWTCVIATLLVILIVKHQHQSDRLDDEHGRGFEKESKVTERLPQVRSNCVTSNAPHNRIGPTVPNPEWDTHQTRPECDRR